ncbi:MAG: DNA alkylation repair protein [Haliscomenobacter sp.]|nr:DNA alkylation repair protein [Haliscomenobacter sp.]
MQTPNPLAYSARLQEVFAQHADPHLAAPMAKYMKNQFLFWGINQPKRKELSQQLVRELGYPKEEDLGELCRLCFQIPYREAQYVVQDLVRPQISRLGVSFLEVVEALIPQKSWWDTVDFLAPKLAGGLFLRFPGALELYTGKWIESPDIWFQRSAILSQLDFKSSTNADLLFGYILRRADSKEFFVRKASGWALRNYSKVNAPAVERFIRTHALLPLLKKRD